MTATIARPMSVKLDQATRGRMDRLARSRRPTTHWLMREAIQQYIEREEKLETYRQAGARHKRVELFGGTGARVNAFRKPCRQRFEKHMP